MSGKERLLKLKEGLAKFKEESAKHGWEDDEVDEKVAEVFENFHWYKFNGENKRTWKTTLWDICLFSLIMYLAVGAYLNKNKRLRKNIKDYMFDLDFPYQQGRITRLLFLPITQFFQLQYLSRQDCLLDNPFFEKEPLSCQFCQNITSIPLLNMNDEDVNEMIENSEPFQLHDLPGYYNSTVGFNDVRDLFTKHGEEMDEAICEIYLSTQHKKVSDYFKLSEEELNQKNYSIGWKNCEGYGARFYRKLYTRPQFISNMSEIMLEKFMFFLQPGQNVPLMDVMDSSSYIVQVQGETTYSFSVPTDCHEDCTNEAMHVDLKSGQIIVYPNAGWKVSARSRNEKLSIIYISAFIPTLS